MANALECLCVCIGVCVCVCSQDSNALTILIGRGLRDSSRQTCHSRCHAFFDSEMSLHRAPISAESASTFATPDGGQLARDDC